MTVMGDPAVFDFSRVFDVIEDVVVRTIDTRDEDRWVEVLVTPSNRRSLWNFSPAFGSYEEALTWMKMTDK